MKAPLFLILAISLTGNVALAIFAFRATSVSSSANHSLEAGTAKASSVTASGNVAGATPKSTAVNAPSFRPPRTDEDLRGLINTLRAAGYPPSVLRAVANQLLSERFAANRPEANQPFWKRSTTTPETVAENQKRANEMMAAREAVLGPDGLPAASLDPVERAKRYGTLSDDKINALIKLEREHSDLRSMAYAGRDSIRAGEDFTSAMQQQRLLEQEKLADLASVLSPAELEQYEMRTSQSASRVQQNLRALDVTEEEYVALYKFQKQADANNAERTGVFTPEMMAKRQAAQATMNEQARAILGDDRFYKYLESADPQYGSVARFAATQPSVSQSTAYEVYKLQQEAQTAMMSATRNRGAGGVTDIQQTLQPFSDRLNQLLTPEVAEVYKKQGMGGIFNAGRNAPRGAPSGAVMAFPLPGGN